MMKRSTKISLLILGAIALGALLAVAGMLMHGVSARDEPTVLEALMARSLRHLAVPRAARGMENTVPLTDEVLVRARAHFADHCALCHGNDGKGETPIGRNLYPKAPDMTSPATQSLPDGELFYIIKNGVRLTGMPAWGDDTPESDQQSWELVHFIRHLPQVSPEELERMQGLNPRSRGDWEEEEEIRKFLGGEEEVPSRQEHRH
jgi:mono/diheme cytochrome c family protein